MKLNTEPPLLGDPHTDNAALVGAEWLAAHLADPRVRVVEVDVSRARYDDGHIDGAVLWNIYTDFRHADYHLVERATLEHLVARSGISPDSTVVFYGYAPALGFWLLSLYGHRDVRILDCAGDTWRAEGYPWNNQLVTPTPVDYRLGEEDRALRATLSEVRDAIGRDSTTLVDVRSAPEYQGECFWPSGSMQSDGRVGHVPTARHQPIDGLYDCRGAFLPAPDLGRVFSSIDLEDRGELITYCAIGGRAATAWFVLTQLLGRQRVRVYDGSWAEWGLAPGTPIERPGDTKGAAKPFIQIIELVTERPDDIEAITDKWKTATEGRRKASRAILAADRDQPDVFLQIVEFPSYDEAMENSRLSETAEFAEQINRLGHRGPSFRNLEVRRVYDLT